MEGWISRGCGSSSRVDGVLMPRGLCSVKLEEHSLDLT